MKATTGMVKKNNKKNPKTKKPPKNSRPKKCECILDACIGVTIQKAEVTPLWAQRRKEAQSDTEKVGTMVMLSIQIKVIVLGGHIHMINTECIKLYTLSIVLDANLLLQKGIKI